MTDTLHQAFREQAGHCENLDSPFMGRLLRLLADHWPEDTALSRKLADWQGDIGPMAASLPLRVCGGLHALRLSGQDDGLDATYPPQSPDDAALWSAVDAALHRHDTFMCAWVDHAPQTNEVRRAAALIAGTALLADRYALPIRLSELGASGGLNLMFDHFALDINDTRLGPDGATVTLAPNWTGKTPPAATPTITERRGVDLNPLDAHDNGDALRLMAYLWPDQAERMARTRAAIALQDAPVDPSDAIDWLETRLPHQPGQMHLIYHTIAWQYFPPEAQARGTQLIEAAGAKATETTPLAWLRMEADGDTPGAGLSLRLWPGNHTIALGRIDFHGRWVDWQAPPRLP
ncbi:DUF2332 family protein [Shimia sp. CNT1-13L.2]|uniref:DUF2332 domain-containing protein n=1 Tax=Shimia sp. CNT1-13L.2 TaxID=2959663 RepID=UPI0020CD73F2|nr:DUF2332 family protein [Shimia sp. CNT1-13L.2]MCP9482682.1 DUF2332 family protein [Shimia sp. CNT1-13L.2]